LITLKGKNHCHPTKRHCPVCGVGIAHAKGKPVSTFCGGCKATRKARDLRKKREDVEAKARLWFPNVKNSLVVDSGKVKL
jgi:uncharacterized Zn finger protein (UPF0148 family)